MSRVVANVLILIVLITFFVVGPVAAAANKTLLVIDGLKYTTQDYRDWWGIWKDPGMDSPATPQEFIDYLLFVEEGRQMEYDLSPEYRRKVEVFLTVRALAALKYEEVDQKIKISEKQIRDFFAKSYTPRWSLQILNYDDQAKAEAVYEQMKVFDGQKAGNLVFADLAGVKAEEGGPVTYDKVAVDPDTLDKTNNNHWLPVIAKLEQWHVSPPFFLEDSKRYVVIRMDEIKVDLGEDALEKKRDFITNKLARQASAELTRQLVERLKKEQHVKVDSELLQKVNLQDDLSEELQNRPVLQMDGLEFSVALLLRNMREEKKLRTSVDDVFLKNLVLNSVISQTVTNNEALQRHYENQPPLKTVYEFYRDNNLRKAVEEGIYKRINVSAEEVEAYYKDNQALYYQPEKLTYAIIQGEGDLLNSISADLSQGADFFDQANAHSLDPQIRTEQEDEIQPAVRAELAKLKTGESGSPCALGQDFALVRLINRIEGKLIPLEEVRGKIKKMLVDEKFRAAKTAYMQELRASKKVEVNQRVWEKLKKEYEK
jgi:hypothetical protein